MGIMVRAIRLGVYDNRRQREGAVFEIQSEASMSTSFTELPYMKQKAGLKILPLSPQEL